MNILLITTDQHRADTLGAYGSRLGATPNLDALAGQGSLFETALTRHPYCRPARWTILTGQHPRTHGIWTNGVDPEEQQIAEAFSTRIARERRRTAFIGKAHFATSGVMVPGRSKYMEAMANAVSMPEHWQGPYMGFEHVDLIELGHYPAGYGPWPLGLHYGKWLAKDGRLRALERFARAGPWSSLPPRRQGPQTWNCRTIVSREWKLNVHCGEPLGELYNRRDDPGEFENRWGDRPRIRAELSDELARRLPAWHEPRRRPVSTLPACATSAF